MSKRGAVRKELREYLLFVHFISFSDLHIVEEALLDVN